MKSDIAIRGLKKNSCSLVVLFADFFVEATVTEGAMHLFPHLEYGEKSLTILGWYVFLATHSLLMGACGRSTENIRGRRV